MAVGTPLGRAVLDAGGCARYANEAALALLGVPAAVSSGPGGRARRFPGHLFAAELAQRASMPFSRFRRLALEDGSTRNFFVHFSRHDGACAVVFEPAEWSLGFLEQVDEGMALTDERAVIVWANRALGRLLGWAPDQLVGHCADEVGRALAARSADVDTVVRAALDGRPLADTFAAVLADGRQHTLQVTTSPWRYCGCVCGMLWRASDVTGASESAQQIAAAMWYRLTALLQHELRNPLQTMQAAVDVLRAEPGIRNAQALSVLEQQVQAISEYLGEQLQPPARGLFPLGRVSEVVAAEIDRAALRLTTRALTFTHVPPKREPPVRLHRPSLARVFANLFRNSAQARADAHVVVDYQVGDRFIACSVTDDGPGFPAGMAGWRRWADIEHPVEHLGLAIVVSTVDAHGGTVDFGAGATGGARVVLHLPLATVGGALQARGG